MRFTICHFPFHLHLFQTLIFLWLPVLTYCLGNHISVRNWRGILISSDFKIWKDICMKAESGFIRSNLFALICNGPQSLTIVTVRMLVYDLNFNPSHVCDTTQQFYFHDLPDLKREPMLPIILITAYHQR